MSDAIAARDRIIERLFVEPATEAAHRRKYPDHWERYEFAARHLGSGPVIDIACGCGYGSALLARAGGGRLVGLDIDQASIEWARRHYGHAATFDLAAENWPLPDGWARAVVCLETIEHVRAPGRFLAEAARVLAPGGRLIASTPLNESETRFAPANPFHIREYDWEEFGALIGTNFEIETRFAQISNLGAAAGRLRGSRIGGATRAVRNRLPSFVAGLGRTVAVFTQWSRRGRIAEGYQSAASVQIVLARKSA